MRWEHGEVGVELRDHRAECGVSVASPAGGDAVGYRIDVLGVEYSSGLIRG